ncbi:LysR family transcriptional regulator YeiE [Lachnospiraceae bacterium KM106-2]|nr:LysR family transcriptional regulator YeiE [Lachnospiraceae bacterium KM106-2]
MLDYRIETFLSVCNCMNYTKAAELLHITQPAVSQHIHHLENEYGTKLFLQEGKKIKLSHAGEILLDTVRTLKNDEKFMINQMNSKTREDIPLKFGTTMTIGEFIITNPLCSYIKNHPDADIQMIISNTNDLLEKLRIGEINFALVEGYYDPKIFEHMTYSTEPFIAACSSSHLFPKEPSVLEDLLDERLLLRELGSGTRDILEKNLDVKGLSVHDFRHTMEISSMHVIVHLLRQNCGISFLYKAAIKNDLEDGTLREVPLKDFHMKHDFTFIWNKHSMFDETYRSICNELKGH